MIRTKKVFLFFIIMLWLKACGGASEVGKVLRNEKTRTTDEFLVKKREPLMLPPDFNTLPKPDSINKEKNVANEKDIGQILKMPKESTSANSSASSVEQSIINQIGK